MSEHIDLIEDESEDQARAEHIGARSPRELAFRTGQPLQPIEPTHRVSLVPGRPRAVPWLVRAHGIAKEVTPR
jgi:hypothetical protein